MFKKIFLKLLLLVFLLLLIYPLTYFSAWVYKVIISHPVSNFFWGPDPYLFAGFLMSLLFVIALFLVFNLRLIISILILLILNIIAITLFWGIWLEDLIILSVSLWLGLIIGEIIKYLTQKIKKQNN